MYTWSTLNMCFAIQLRSCKSARLTGDKIVSAQENASQLRKIRAGIT